MNNYTNWDTWETVNWVLNSEAIVKSILQSNNSEATKIITQHMTMVKYCYASNVDLNEVNMQEVINTVKNN